MRGGGGRVRLNPRDHARGSREGFGRLSEEFGERRDIIGKGLRVIARGGVSRDRGITRVILGTQTRPLSEIQAVKVIYS